MDMLGEMVQGVAVSKACATGHFREMPWLCLEETLAGSRGVKVGSGSGPGVGLDLWSGCSGVGFG